MESALADRVGKKTVLIVGNACNGLGDLSCARKVADVFQTLGKIPAEQITIASNTDEVFRNIFDPEKTYDVIPLAEVTTLKDVVFAVIAPFMSGFTGPDISCEGRYPSLFLSEYDVDTPYVSPLLENITSNGLLGFGSLGLLIDRELIPNGTKNRAKQLLTLEPNLQKIVSDAMLYVGYASRPESKLAFVRAICRADKKSENNLIFVLPGAQLPWDEKLAFAGVKELRQVVRNDDASLTNLKSQILSDKGKCITILYGILRFSELKVLWKLSERDVLATGDQSLTEAISANKSVLYERLIHKKTLALRLEENYKHEFEMSFAPDLSSNDMVYEMLKAITTRRNQDYKTTNQANRHIWENHDCGKKLIYKAEKLLRRSADATYPKDLRNAPLADLAKDLPFNEAVMLNIDQICSLRIKNDGTSERSDLKDSRFDAPQIASDLYLVQRSKCSLNSSE
jgi:hypothetical protein